MSTFQELTLDDYVSKRKEITSKQRNRSVLMFWSTFNAYFNHYNNIIDELSFLKDTVPVENHSLAIEHYTIQYEIILDVPTYPFLETY